MVVEERLEQRICRELPHFPAEWAEALARAIEKLVMAFRPERIYVFGSQARGTAGPESDIDLLIIVPSSDEPGYRRDQEAYRVLGWLTLPIELMVMTRAEFDERLPALASLPATVAREGRVLYAA